MTSAELRARIEANPHNLPGVEGAPPLSPHFYWAARFEAEGRAGYPHGCNPYKAGTMACERWAAGWSQGDDAAGLRDIMADGADAARHGYGAERNPYRVATFDGVRVHCPPAGFYAKADAWAMGHAAAVQVAA